jgi:4-alpha-glucanotransferase
MSAPTAEALQDLARWAGVQPAYVDTEGHEQRVDDDTLVAVLRSLGHPVERPADAPGALTDALASRVDRVLEPVLTLRAGDAPSVQLVLPMGLDLSQVWLELQLEDGTLRRSRVSVLTGLHEPSSPATPVPLEPMGGPIPAGYHEVSVEGPGFSASALLVAAPRCPRATRGWGAFSPVYALRSAEPEGAGTYGDLAELGGWLATTGAAFVGTLPLYPIFLDTPIDPSPYRPVTRLGLCELYVQPNALPEFNLVPEAQQLVGSTESRAALERADLGRFVDYDAVSALRWPVLEALAAALPRVAPARMAALEKFAASRPELTAYSAFMARRRRHGHDWRRWDQATSDPRSVLEDPLARPYLYGQWVAATQLEQAARALPIFGDFPIGVHPDGFDPFFAREAFADSSSGGAPPDAFYKQGQNWAFPPLHPQAMREHRYGYLIACLRHAFEHVGALRVDHVMGLHRLYWIPDGADARHGAYVTYPAQELRSIVSLEAHRAGAVVAGEDLGTVDPAVRQAMADDGMLRTWVLEFESSRDDPLPRPPADCVASWGTHDLPRFAAFFDGDDLDEIVALGSDSALRGAREARESWRRRFEAAISAPPLSVPPADTPDANRGFAGALAHLASSEAVLTMVDLADVWGERHRENLPGTGPERPNWRLRAARSLDLAQCDPAVDAALRGVDQLRRSGVPEDAAR